MDNAWIEDDETIREFIVESHENLERLDRDLVELEKHPHDSVLLSSVFRTFHTIKGSCGFLALSLLEQIAHQAENLLSQLRDGKRVLTPEIVSLILETVDATRKVLASLESTGREGDAKFEDLIERLQKMAQSAPPAPENPGTNPSKPPAEAKAGAESPKPVPELVSPKCVSQSAEEVVPAKASDGSVEAQGEIAAAEEEHAKSSSAVDANIRVGVVLLDKLMDLVGELVLTRNQILQTTLDRDDAMLNTSYQRLNLITTELQEHVMKTRMQPIRVVWGNLPRIVRDMAVSLNKQIELKMEGAETELDRTIIEAIKDPLIHLVRNSCDHGIEFPDIRTAAGKPAGGTMTLRAYHEGGQVTIEVCDDGGGIDLEKVRQKAVQKGLIRSEAAATLSERESVNLIFHPGISTAESVTKISGRGVGMDVVKSQIERIGGIIDIFTCAGEGTTIKIRIPLTLAIIPGLIVTCSGERFVIPQVSLLELIQLDGEVDGKHVEYLNGAPVYRRRGSLLPVVYLNDVLGFPRPAENAATNMVVLQTEDRQFGLIVDGINDTQEIVVKPLGKQFKGLSLYAGATIMGDGKIALILDVLGIGQSSGVLREARERSAESKAKAVDSEQAQQRLLLVKSGSFDRIAIPLSLVARLEEFPRNAIESAGGECVMQYRDRILPLVFLNKVLEQDGQTNLESMDSLPVVVFNDGERSVGVVVDQIVDVTEESVSVRLQSRRKGFLGSAVVGKLVTDFLDIGAVIDASSERWLHSGLNSTRKFTVLLAGNSIFSRGMVRGMLEMSRHSVIEAADGVEAARLLASKDIHAAIALLGENRDLEIAQSLLEHAATRPSPIPIFAVVESPDDLDVASYRNAGFRHCLSMRDRAGIIDSLERSLTSPAQPCTQSEYVQEVVTC